MKFILNLIISVVFPVVVSLTASAQVQAITIPDESGRNDSRIQNNFDDRQRIQETLYQQWRESGAWGNTTRHTFNWDNNDRIRTTTIQIWRQGMWLNGAREIESFDLNNNLVAFVHEEWSDGGIWLPLWRDNYVYDRNNNLTEWRHDTRSGLRTWDHEWRHLYAYNEAGNINERSYQEWDRNRWNTISQITYQYDSENRLIQSFTYNLTGRAPARDLNFLYSYNENGLMNGFSERKWTGETWRDLKLERYHYDDEGRLTVTDYLEPGTGENLILRSRDIYRYTTDSDTLERIREELDTAGNMAEVWRYVYIYDYRGFKITKSYLVRRDKDWVENFRTSYTYDVFGNQTTSVTLR